MYYKKLLLTALTAMSIFSTTANAAWMPGLRVKLLAPYPNGDILVSFDKKPEDTCNSWGFEFVIKSDKGNVYKALRSAQVLNETVQIVYEPSTTIGAEKNDCKVAKILTVITE